MLKPAYTWESFLMYGQMLKVKKNAVVYRQGENGRGIYYLSKGGINIVLLSDKGDERVVDYVPTGSLFGEHGVNKEPYLTTAIASSPSVIYHFSDEALAELYKDFPDAIMMFTNSLIYKMRILAEVISFLDSPIEQQMAYYLLKLSRIQENEEIAINQTTFARHIGTSRITVNKIMKKWKSEGLIEVSNRAIHITDRCRVKAIAANMEPIERANLSVF